VGGGRPGVLAPAAAVAYERFTAADADALRAEFVANQRANLLE